MTGYNYRHASVQIDEIDLQTRVLTHHQGKPSLDVTFEEIDETAQLPTGSPFPDWRTARQFAGPMPFTFSPEGDGTFVVIEGSRGSWVPRPVAVKEWQVGLFQEASFIGVEPTLANAFSVKTVDYRWSSGRVVRPEGIL